MIKTIRNSMIEYFGNDVKRINHALKVHAFADILAESLALDDKTRSVISHTAYLHDIGIKESERKYNSSAGKYQETEGPPVARAIMESLSVSPDIIERTCFIIGNHHTYTKIDGIDFQIIVEADFLVNIYEDEMSKDAVDSALNRIFKTRKGIELLKGMYQK